MAEPKERKKKSKRGNDLIRERVLQDLVKQASPQFQEYMKRRQAGGAQVLAGGTSPEGVPNPSPPPSMAPVFPGWGVDEQIRLGPFDLPPGQVGGMNSGLHGPVTYYPEAPMPEIALPEIPTAPMPGHLTPGYPYEDDPRGGAIPPDWRHWLFPEKYGPEMPEQQHIRLLQLLGIV